MWFPGQLPYLIKADRVSDVVHHVPESARVYADRVEQNVPILSESVAVAAPDAVSGMPATGGEPSCSSKGDTSRPSARPHELLAPDAKAFEEAPPTPGHPSDLPSTGSTTLCLILELKRNFSQQESQKRNLGTSR